MIARCRMEDALFRHSSRGREPLAAAGESANHAHYQSSQSPGIGTITSRSKDQFTFWQYLAFELAGAGDPARAIVPFCTVEQAMKLHAEGLIT